MCMTSLIEWTVLASWASSTLPPIQLVLLIIDGCLWGRTVKRFEMAYSLGVSGGSASVIFVARWEGALVKKSEAALQVHERKYFLEQFLQESFDLGAYLHMFLAPNRTCRYTCVCKSASISHSLSFTVLSKKRHWHNDPQALPSFFTYLILSTVSLNHSLSACLSISHSHSNSTENVMVLLWFSMAAPWNQASFHKIMMLQPLSCLPNCLFLDSNYASALLQGVLI